MKTDWTWTRVGLVTDLTRRGISPAYTESEGIPVVSQKCVRNDLLFDPDRARLTDGKMQPVPDALLLREGDSLINSTGDGTLGRVAFFPGNDSAMTFDSHVTLVRPNEKMVHPRFLSYLLFDNEKRFIRFSQGSTKQTELSRDVVLNIPFPAISVKKQRRISDYLDQETGQIDETITRIDKVVEFLEERREAFRLSTLFGSKSSTRTFMQSRLGPQIPSHWTESKFGLEFRESNEFVGTSPVGPLLSISEYRGVEVNNRTNGQRPSETVSHYRTLRRGQLAVNTMWLNHGGLAVSDLDGYISPDYRAYEISPKLDPQFAHFLMRSKPMVDYFAVVSTGVRPNAQRVTSTVLQNVPVVVPPLDEQKKISQILSREGEETSRLISKANLVRDLLKERRSALITAAVTGKIEV